ncbi:hypothetical protein Lesp02_24730 [Lentzea sp. NBRC 105346]|uniref:hypothetical protein n=1 Tax=Lentzea sp. NBRC 105346 TaxID=3032205 RepID=UPI002552DD0D|nr:hypothetical protein [Lentzea sp. NBRC 105346]GLZ30283.1 hypothetical protein Lesp02_24730 [Lentzea sp. NBRC 105346]
MKTTAILTTSSRSRRITWGFGLGIALGLMGLPLVFVAIWPGADHSPWAANTVVLAAGVFLSSLSYIFGRIAVSALTEDRVTPPTKRPYFVAAGAFVVGVLSLLIAMA